MSSERHISLVVPCFNEAARLSPAAFLGFVQSAQGVRFILVDDGSTDDTRQILQRMCDTEPSRFVLVVHAHNPLVKMERIKLGDLAGFTWLLPPADTPTRAAINEVFAKAKAAPPVATVEASSIKLIHLTLKADPRMLSIVPSDAGHDIERLGGVRRLPFPVPLHIPPIGLISAARHRDTPIVRKLRSTLRELVRKRREAA